MRQFVLAAGDLDVDATEAAVHLGVGGRVADGVVVCAVIGGALHGLVEAIGVVEGFAAGGGGKLLHGEDGVRSLRGRGVEGRHGGVGGAACMANAGAAARRSGI